MQSNRACYPVRVLQLRIAMASTWHSKPVAWLTNATVAADLINGELLSRAMDESSKEMITAMGEEACLNDWGRYCSQAASMIDAVPPDFTKLEPVLQVRPLLASS